MMVMVNLPKRFMIWLNDGIRSSFDADIVLETRREVDGMVNPPKWAKELPAAAVLTAFEAMRCVSDKDLEQLNDPENQKRFVQALKDATFRNAGNTDSLQKCTKYDKYHDVFGTHIYGSGKNTLFCIKQISHEISETQEEIRMWDLANVMA